MMAFNSFEGNFLQNIDRNISKGKEEKITKVAYEMMRKVKEKEVFNPQDLGDLYDKEEIDHDLKNVEKKKILFEKNATSEQKETKKHADILEAIVHDQIRENNWLGKNAEPFKTSNYDDIINGVDEVVEFYNEDEDESISSRLALAVDVTFSGQLAGKFKRIREEIERGEMAKVKYFSSEKSGHRGELKMLPRVVIGIEMKNLKKLEAEWVKENSDLSRHPFQMLMLEEIKIQLMTFSRYAKERGQDEVAAVYDRTNQSIIEILDKKSKGNGLSTMILADDKVFKEIRRQLEEVREIQ